MEGKRSNSGGGGNMTYEKQQINRIFLGGDENKIGWHDRQLGKELPFNLEVFSGRH